jgi:hypothetical protein
MRNDDPREDVTTPVLLRKIAKSGWSEDLARRFEAHYDRDMRWIVINNMEKLGLLQSRVHPERVSLLTDRRLELFENTISDLWVELSDGLVERYVKGVEGDRIHQPFVPYLRGVVRHIVLENARTLGLIGRESPAELIAAVCEARRDRTLHGRIAWLKFCLAAKARQDLLQCCGRDAFALVYKNVHRVADYFFEQFVPQHCAEVKTMGTRVLDELVRRFAESPLLPEAAQYVGHVTPFAAGADVTMRVPYNVNEDEYLSGLDRAAEGTWR